MIKIYEENILLKNNYLEVKEEKKDGGYKSSLTPFECTLLCILHTNNLNCFLTAKTSLISFRTEFKNFILEVIFKSGFQ